MSLKKKGKRGVPAPQCPRCGRPLELRLGIARSTGNPYDYLACSNARCAEREAAPLLSGLAIPVKRKQYMPEEIMAALRSVAAFVQDGAPVADACRISGISKTNFYVWREKYGAFGVRRPWRKKTKRGADDGITDR